MRRQVRQIGRDGLHPESHGRGMMRQDIQHACTDIDSGNLDAKPGKQQRMEPRTRSRIHCSPDTVVLHQQPEERLFFDKPPFKSRHGIVTAGEPIVELRDVF